MSNVIDPQSYQEVMRQLGAYGNRVFEIMSSMRSAAQNCKDNMEDDDAVVRSMERLEQCLSRMREGLDKINEVQAAMRRELEDALEAQRQAKFD